MGSSHVSDWTEGGEREVLAKRIADAMLTIEDLERRRNMEETSLRAGRAHLDSLQPYDRGWMLEVIVPIAAISILLEWYPARMMSLVFFFASHIELNALTAAFAVSGFFLGFVEGELLRRYRVPQPHSVVDRSLLVAVSAAIVAFLIVGYILRVGYATAASDALAGPLSPGAQAAALTTLATIGIIMAVASGYCRESIEAWAVRKRLARLRHDLRSDVHLLEATRRELTSSERAFRTLSGENSFVGGRGPLGRG